MADEQPRKRVVAKPVYERSTRSKRDVYAEVCYYFPQYRLEDVAIMPVRDVNLLLRTARRIEARRMHDLVQVVAAPHTEKGRGVKQLSDYFKKESER